MGYKETVMSEEQIIEAIKEARKDPVKAYARYRAVSSKQAKLTWPIAEKAGIKRVIDWSNEWCPHRDNDFPCPDHVPDELRLHKRDCPDCWQAFLEVEK